MSSYTQPGAVLPIKLAGTTAKHALVAVGQAYAVALAGGGENDIVQAAFGGVFPIPKTADVVVAQGAQLYLSSGALTTTANTTPVGIAAEAAAGADTIVQCKINVHSGTALLAAAAASAAALYTPL